MRYFLYLHFGLIVLLSCAQSKKINLQGNQGISIIEYSKIEDGIYEVTVKNNFLDTVIIDAGVSSGLNDYILSHREKRTNVVFFSIANKIDTVIHFPLYDFYYPKSKYVTLSHKKTTNLKIDLKKFFDWNTFKNNMKENNFKCKLRIFYFKEGRWENEEIILSLI